MAMQKRQKQLDRHVKIKVVGVGGAGTNAVDRLVLEGFQDINILSVNTDTQHLTASVVPEKIQIGAQRTRGLGAGGDPKVGSEAAFEDEMELRTALTGYDLVFLAAGMGGGTGTGAGPVLAQIAKQQGALVLALVTLPFSSEGKHRCRVAQQGLEVMRRSADAVICIPNDRLLSLAEEETSVLDAFRPTDQFLCDGVKLIYSMLAKTGLINIDFADLSAVLRREKGETLVGYGTGRGDGKVEDAVRAALKSPLLSQTEILKQASAALVCMTYGPATTMREVNEGMSILQENLGDETAIKVGYVIDEKIGNEVCVLVIASTGRASKIAGARKASDKPETAEHEEQTVVPVDVEAPVIETLPMEPEAGDSEPELEAGEPMPEEVVGVGAATAPERPQEIFLGMKPAAASTAASIKQRQPKKDAPRQVSLPLDDTTHGIFDKHDRLIINGQDLDVPTFLRMGIRLQRTYR
jgi:cell division protein FtsZ